MAMRRCNTHHYTYRIEFNRNRGTGDEIMYVSASNIYQAIDTCRLTFCQEVIITEVSQVCNLK